MSTSPRDHSKAPLKLHRVERVPDNNVASSSSECSRSLTDTHYSEPNLTDRETKEHKDSVNTDEENNKEALTSKVNFKGE